MIASKVGSKVRSNHYTRSLHNTLSIARYNVTIVNKYDVYRCSKVQFCGETRSYSELIKLYLELQNFLTNLVI